MNNLESQNNDQDTNLEKHSFLQRVRNYFSIRWHRLGLMFVSVLLVFLYIVLISAPSSFPSGEIYTIDEGATISEVVEDLHKKDIIRNPLLAKVFAKIFGGDRGVLAGQYYLNFRADAISLMYRFSNGVFGIKPIRVTIFEGFTSYQIGDLLDDILEDFDRDSFVRRAEAKEGYLFPDTYYFLPTANPGEILFEMEMTFDERIVELEEEIAEFGMPLEDVLIMASLIEREARRTEVRQKIAGILWKRIEIGMPLQVDAVFGYINERETYNPSFEDLEIDSPYNTYENKGLPPGPISNPGLDAIFATVNPIESNYLFYLTGRDGVTRYAETFEGHKENRRLYLD